MGKVVANGYCIDLLGSYRTFSAGLRKRIPTGRRGVCTSADMQCFCFLKMAIEEVDRPVDGARKRVSRYNTDF